MFGLLNMDVKNSEAQVRRYRAAAEQGDEKAQQWLRENEWRVKTVRSTHDELKKANDAMNE